MRLPVVLPFVAILALSSPARADDEPVLVVTEDAGAPLAKRLAQELERGGYHAAIVSAATGTDFSAEAALHQARVVLRVSPRGDSIDVWAADAVGHVVRFRERLAAAPDAEDSSVLAIRAEEAVRGELLSPAPEKVRETAAPEPPPASPPPPRVAAEFTPTFSASAGPSVSIGHDGAGAGGGAALGFSWLPTERVGIDFLARVPVLASSIDAPEGSARLSVTVLGAGASIASAPPDALLRASVGAGAALAWSHVDGVAAASFVSHDEDLFSAMFYLRLGAGVRLTRRLRLRADVLGGVFAPLQQVFFSARQVASVGNPMVDGALSVEALW